MQRWGREFDALEEKLKMGVRVQSAITNILEAINCGKPGVTKNHVLPNTFVKNYYAPQVHIYSRPAKGNASWTGIPIRDVVTRHDFYTISHADGTDKISLERLFQNIESHVPDWLRDDGVSSYHRGEPEYWMAWFLAAQAQRTPYAAKIRREHHKNTPANIPEGALVLANLTEAKLLARRIFSWHWEFQRLDRYPPTQELFLGETCGFRSGTGILCHVRRHTILICSPDIATQCETRELPSREDEVRTVQELNQLMIRTNAAHDGHIYRGDAPNPLPVGTHGP